MNTMFSPRDIISAAYVCLRECQVTVLRPAVSEFVELYNDHWLIEKNGYLSPADARRAYYESKVA